MTDKELDNLFKLLIKFDEVGSIGEDLIHECNEIRHRINKEKDKRFKEKWENKE